MTYSLCHLERSREISSFIFMKQPAAVIPTRIAGQSEYQGSLFIKPLRTLAKTSFGEFLLPLLSMGEGRIRYSAGNPRWDDGSGKVLGE